MNWFTPDKLFYQEWDFWVSAFTLILAGFTLWLALETRGLRKDSAKAIKAARASAKAAVGMASTMNDQLITMRQQLAAGFVPDVTIAFINHSELRGADDSEDVAGAVQVVNHSTVPIKLAGIKLAVAGPDVKSESTLLEDSSIVIPVGQNRVFKYILRVERGTLKKEYRMSALVYCADLANLSKHSFAMVDGAANINHYLGFKET
jgi:LEA14-like dessication related protein